jgi:hypothetical protein
MIRQGVIAMNTNPEVLPPATAIRSLCDPLLNLRIGQFFTGMASGRTCCAKLPGAKTATALNVTHNSTKPYLENLSRVHSDFIAASSSSLGLWAIL